MIPLAEFGELRSRDFVTDEEVTDLSNWEFLGRTWVGEVVGFTEWVRPVEDQASLGCVSIDLGALDPECARAILARLGLPLELGMTLDQVTRACGAPTHHDEYAKDRRSYYFTVGDEDSYVLSCTILHEGGLTYVVMAPKGMGLEL